MGQLEVNHSDEISVARTAKPRCLYSAIFRCDIERKFLRPTTQNEIAFIEITDIGIG